MYAINEKVYGKLLAKTPPRRIETEEQNERYLETIEMMIDKGADNFTPEEHTFFDLLVMLVEEFEARTYPMPQTEPHERLKYLVKEKGLKQRDLMPILGSEGVVSDTLSGRRDISLKVARKLSEFLNVPVEMFI